MNGQKSMDMNDKFDEYDKQKSMDIKVNGQKSMDMNRLKSTDMNGQKSMMRIDINRWIKIDQIDKLQEWKSMDMNKQKSIDINGQKSVDMNYE